DNGWPDEGRFAAVVGDLVTRIAGRRLRIRVFGEMVALLWERGQREAAIHLEKLWNALGQQHRFALLCAYPMAGFRGVADDAPLLQVCAQHSETIPVESYTALQHAEERLREVAQLQQKARALQTQIEERERAQRSLQRFQLEFTDFFENAAMALHWLGPDGTI